MNWKYNPDTGQLTLIRGEKEHYVKELKLCANGTHDIYMVKTPQNTLELRQTLQLKTSDDIIHHYVDDVLIIEWRKPYPYGDKFLYMEVDESMLPMLKVVLNHNEITKGSEYDAYMGRFLIE